MPSTEIIWRTDRGDMAGVTVHAAERHDNRVRLVIGLGPTCLRLPRTEARLLAQALLDAADAVPEPTARRVIPIHAAPPAALYHDPDHF